MFLRPVGFETTIGAFLFGNTSRPMQDWQELMCKPIGK
jgi:hypothetical protein